MSTARRTTRTRGTSGTRGARATGPSAPGPVTLRDQLLEMFMVVVSDTDATEATGARQVPWREFFTWFRRTWRQGEHVSLIGPTGSGKTTLGIHLIALRPYVTAFAVKPQDDTMHKLLRAGYMLE